MRKIALVCIGLAAAGCFEQFDATDDEETSEGDETGGDGDNLLVNSSFEDWAGGVPVAWTPSPTLSTAIGDVQPHDGQSYVQLIADEYSDLRQTVGFSVPLQAGEVVAVELAYRWVEGDVAAIGVDLHGHRLDGEVFLLPPIFPMPFTAEGWTIGGGSSVVPEEIVAVTVVLVLGGFTPQTIEADAVRVWVD